MREIESRGHYTVEYGTHYKRSYGERERRAALKLIDAGKVNVRAKHSGRVARPNSPGYSDHHAELVLVLA